MALNHGADGQVVLGITTADLESLPVRWEHRISLQRHCCRGHKFCLSNFAGSCVDFVTQSSMESLRTNCMNPTTPHFKAFNLKPRVGHLRAFGCPVSFKRYNPSTPTGRLTKKQQIQKSSTRGMFIGLPPKQAGCLIYVEDRIGTANIIVSQDVTFDEHFRSAIACDVQPFQGAHAHQRFS